MSVSDTEKALRRRILFNSLDEGTPVEVIQRAIDLLDNEFSDQPQMRYMALINRLRESFDHPAFQSHSLLGRIMKIRNMPAEQIGPDPRFALPSSGSSPSASTANGPQVMLQGRDLVFNTLLKHISVFVAKRSPESESAYRKNFLDNAVKMELNAACGKSLVSWAKSNVEMSSISGSDEELHKIINAAFVWMCGKFGPVDADKILLHAVSMTEQLPEAFDHSPRKFL